MLHHYADSNKGFGVSFSLWDKIMGSDFNEQKVKNTPKVK